MISPHRDEVIAIGALGGSGTRAVARLLLDAGIYMGDPLNSANDNVVFTAIFVDTQWLANADKAEVDSRIGMFEEYMRSGHISKEDLKKIERLPYEYSHQYPPDLFPTLKKKKPEKIIRSSWGWKEPNTQIYLEPLAKYFPNFRYIHVLRHGLDMAFARNKKQLFNWGHLFGISADRGETEEELARKQLEYWIRSTKAVLETGRQLLAERFYLLRYEDVCTHPEREIPPLLDFIGRRSGDVRDLKDIFQLSEGTGRYRKNDLSIFTQEQLEAVRELGFEI